MPYTQQDQDFDDILGSSLHRDAIGGSNVTHRIQVLPCTRVRYVFSIRYYTVWGGDVFCVHFANTFSIHTPFPRDESVVSMDPPILFYTSLSRIRSVPPRPSTPVDFPFLLTPSPFRRRDHILLYKGPPCQDSHLEHCALRGHWCTTYTTWVRRRWRVGGIGTNQSICGCSQHRQQCER